ncbi:MAG TPA: hypothetical protein DCE41_04190 [Cytophagales bacterium]|nr:hypothetical protein [Cytophagales bacterium]HAA18476.1 hypothetical protein [Cytophagales bacterium]HAP61497.1 hypothetical protein [Cytophagales bacterium]
MQEFKYGTIDVSEYPLVRLTTSGEKLVEEDIKEYFLALEEALNQFSGPYVSISNINKIFVDSETRIRVGRWSDKFIQRMNGRGLATVIVNENTISRMMLKGIMRVMKQPMEFKVVGSTAEAEKLAYKLLEEAGLEVTVPVS